MILAKQIIDKSKPRSKALDIGSGKGRELLYFIEQGLDVTGIDKVRRIDSDKIIETGIKDYSFSDFDLINCSFVLHFLEKQEALNVLNKTKKHSKYATLSLFSEKDPGFKSGQGYFTEEEIKDILKNWDIVHLKEKEILDKGHKGMPFEHEHHIIYLIASQTD